MARIDETLSAGLKTLGEKPPDTASGPTKKNYSQRVSEVFAASIASEFRARGMTGTLPAPPGTTGKSGAERRLMGGVGPKKVDVSWATEEAGLMLAVSVKSINFRDQKTKNFQKNLTNRRGDMLFESITLHRRFPYSVLAGFLVLDKDAAMDFTKKRSSTFDNAHARLELFTGRDDPAGRDEQYEKLYVVLLDGNPFKPVFKTYEVGFPADPVDLSFAFEQITEQVAKRNSDFYEYRDGAISLV